VEGLGVHWVRVQMCGYRVVFADGTQRTIVVLVRRSYGRRGMIFAEISLTSCWGVETGVVSVGLVSYHDIGLRV
jgi:hypothetical protein